MIPVIQYFVPPVPLIERGESRCEEGSKKSIHFNGSDEEYERKFDQLSEDQKLSKLCSDAGLKVVETGQYFCILDTQEGQQMEHLCREYTMPSMKGRTRIRGWILKNTRIGPVFNLKSLLS